MCRRKHWDLRKLKKTVEVKVPIGLSNGKNVVITLKDVPTYKFHRFQKKLVCLSDICEKLNDLGIDPEDEETLTPDELKKILTVHSAFRKAKDRKFSICGFNFEG